MSCNVQIAAGVTLIIAAGGTFSVYYVSSACGKLDIPGTLKIGDGTGSATIGCYSGTVPITIDSGGTLNLQQNDYSASCAGTAPSITVAGSLVWGWENTWSCTVQLSGGQVQVMNSLGATAGTFASSGGTLTDPGVGNVLSGTAYEIMGANKTGTLTVPSAGNVLTGTSYGVGGNGSTGTLALPSAGNVLTGTSYGVGGNGLTGTRTDCPAADAVSGTSYGAGGNSITGSYPTTAASQAAQLATDTAAVTAAQASILNTATILGVAGTLTLPSATLRAQRHELRRGRQRIDGHAD